MGRGALPGRGGRARSLRERARKAPRPIPLRILMPGIDN